MNKKYIDFVPSRAVKKPVGRGVTKKSVTKKVEKKELVSKKSIPEVVQPEIDLMHEELSVGDGNLDMEADTFSLKKEPRYGVVEDFRPKFVKTEVPKRPLSKGHFISKRSELTEAKSVKVSARKVGKPVEKPVEKSAVLGEKSKDKTKMQIPKSPFINQAKVPKRPLSKNVYEKKIEPSKELATGPVTIISKPEKDAKAGRIVAIILAIILGAAAGTVAFLLLPK